MHLTSGTWRRLLSKETWWLQGLRETSLFEGRKERKSQRKSLCLEIGALIGKLHQYGLIHGDLTTSNMIVNSEGKIFFVDFGLGEKTRELEARGIDLHLTKRALQSTHFRFAEECFDAVIEGYIKVLSTKIAVNNL